MNQKKRYSHLFFDLDNTLWDFDSNSLAAMQKAFEFFNLQSVNTCFQNFFDEFKCNNSFLWDEYRKNRVMKNELIRLRFQNTFEALGITGIHPEEMNEVYLAEMSKQTLLVNGTEKVLQILKSRGYKMAIITNGFAGVQKAKLKSSGIGRYFTKIYISEEIKSPKPDRKIFEFALKSSNAPKKSSLMIGDDFASDIEGALDFGIDAVLFDPAGKFLNITRDENIRYPNLLYFIRSMEGLIHIV